MLTLAAATRLNESGFRVYKTRLQHSLRARVTGLSCLCPSVHFHPGSRVGGRGGGGCGAGGGGGDGIITVMMVVMVVVVMAVVMLRDITDSRVQST